MLVKFFVNQVRFLKMTNEQIVDIALKLRGYSSELEELSWKISKLIEDLPWEIDEIDNTSADSESQDD